MMMPVSGIFSWLMILLLSGGPIMGLPPGPRDASLLKLAPAETIFYAEWAGRTAGREGAKGVEGLVADPEIVLFLDTLEAAISKQAKASQSDMPAARTLKSSMPSLVKALLKHPGAVYVTIDVERLTKGLADLDKPVAQPMPLPAPRRRIARPVVGGPAMDVSAWLRGALIINAGNDADQVAKSLELIVTVLNQNTPTDTTSKLSAQAVPAVPQESPSSASGKLQRVRIPTSPSRPEIILHRHGNYFILTQGAGELDKVLAALEGKPSGKRTSLGDLPQYAASAQQVQFERFSSVSFVNLNLLAGNLASALGPRKSMVEMVRTTLGLESATALVSGTGLIDGQIRTKTRLLTGGKLGGVFSLAAGRPIRPADFQAIPVDADLVVAISLSLPKIHTALRDLLSKADPASLTAYDGTISQLEKDLGISLADDLFAGFGDVWTIYNSPTTGGLIATQPVAALEIKNRQKAEKGYGALMKIIASTTDPPGERAGNRFFWSEFKQGKFRDHTIHYVNLVGPGVPFSPAFCLTETHLLFAPTPQGLKAHLRFVAGKSDRFAKRFDAVNLPGEGDQIAFSYVDSKKLLQLVYGFAPYFFQSAVSVAQRQGFEFDGMAIPSIQAFLPYISHSSLAIRRTSDGIVVESQAGVPFLSGTSLVVPMMMLGRGPGLFFGLGEELEEEEVAKALQEVEDEVEEEMEEGQMEVMPFRGIEVPFNP